LDRNPYAAPKSAVPEPADPRGERPRAVTIAVMLLSAIIVWTAWTFFDLLGAVQVGEVSITAIAWRAAKVAFSIPLCVYIARGRNWARYTQAVIVAAGVSLQAFNLWLLPVPSSVGYVVDPLAVVMWLLPGVVGLAALWLLFVPGRRWFRDPGVQ
jgi:hypothetical protein